MFYALALALCLAVLFLVMACGSALLLPAMQMMKKVFPFSTMVSANALFAARLLPFGIACAATLGLALPAFLLFEPHSTKEGMGWRLAVLAFAGAAVVAGMGVRGWRILRDTRGAQRRWRKDSQRTSVDGIGLPVYCVENGASLLAVVGIVRPRIFVAREIMEALSADELRAALAHELAHISSIDNLKQFLLKITCPPTWMGSFQAADAAWVSASEIAADQGALLRGASVLDLSSALIKAGRLRRPHAAAETLASHLVPPACGSALETRIARLSELLEREQMPRAAKPVRLALPLAVVALTYLACIHAVLPAVHEALEFLVR